MFVDRSITVFVTRIGGIQKRNRGLRSSCTATVTFPRFENSRNVEMSARPLILPRKCD